MSLNSFLEVKGELQNVGSEPDCGLESHREVKHASTGCLCGEVCAGTVDLEVRNAVAPNHPVPNLVPHDVNPIDPSKLASEADAIFRGS